MPYTEYLEQLYKPSTLLGLALLFVIVYTVLKIFSGTRAMSMAAGLAAFWLLRQLALSYKLSPLDDILRGAMIYLPVLLIVLFQPEIRQVFISLGDRIRIPWFLRHRGQFGEDAYDEIVLAATTLASTKTGALIVIERDVSLRSVIEGGVKMDAELSYDLLVTIFNPATPLHDGAVVVRRHRVAAAACFFPLSFNPGISRDLGTRHRAAIGITEDTDAIAVVVSEETGLISFTQGGTIRRGLDATRLRARIMDAMEPHVPRADEIKPTQGET